MFQEKVNRTKVVITNVLQYTIAKSNRLNVVITKAVGARVFARFF